MHARDSKSSSPVADGSIYTNGAYTAMHPSYHVEDSRWKADQIASILRRNGITPRMVAEIGCGAGEVLRHLSDRYVEARFVGFEISQEALDLCAAREGERVHFRHGSIDAIDEAFDLLLCVDVFEHVDDYLGFLTSLRRRATYKVFHIPLDVTILNLIRDGLMASRRRYGHLHYFTLSTAFATLEDCGYEILDHHLTPSFRDLPQTRMLSRLARLPRRLLFALSPRLMQLTLGGSSLMVLAR